MHTSNSKIIAATVIGLFAASNIYVAFSISAVKTQVLEVQGLVIDLGKTVNEIKLYKSATVTNYTAAEMHCLAKKYIL